jgi:small-conductance mechanosensitive channel
MGPSFLAGALQTASTNSTTSTTVASATSSLLFILLEIVGLLLVIVVIGTVLGTVVRTIALRAGASKAVASAIRYWTWVIMLVGAVVGVAYITGISSEITTLTISGIGGLTISLALQTTISNIIAGVLLLNEGIIRLGDDIQFGGPGGVRGEVVKLSLRSTWITTPDGVITVIGNSNLSAGPIMNFSAKARLEKKIQG